MNGECEVIMLERTVAEKARDIYLSGKKLANYKQRNLSETVNLLTKF